MSAANSTTINEQAAAPASRTTVSNPFFACQTDGQNLFTVREGVPAMEALEQVSTFLSAAKDAATLAACEADGTESGAMWSCVFIIEAAKATLDATTSGIAREARPATAQGVEAAPSVAAPAVAGSDRDEILDVVRTMDMHSQAAFDRIEALANMALKLLQLPETYRNPDDLAEALKTIRYTAMDIRNIVNCEAESVGSHYIGDLEQVSSRARWDAMREAARGEEAKKEMAQP
jgi:DUF3077 family protein